jgi:uncharacterized SAM-binding protein YcdF (DUF218 family)
MFALFKWLLWFCLPSTLVLVGMLAVACWLFWRKQYRPAVVLFCLDALLTFVMLPWTSMTLGLSLERQYPPKVITDYPNADAIVLLGGGLGATRPGFPHTECYAAADRAIMAFRL